MGYHWGTNETVLEEVSSCAAVCHNVIDIDIKKRYSLDKCAVMFGVVLHNHLTTDQKVGSSNLPGRAILFNVLDRKSALHTALLLCWGHG